MIDISKYISRYERSEITLFLLKNKSENKIYNFYSLIELCPLGQFPSSWVHEKRQAKCIEINEIYDFIIDKIQIDTKTALEYYASDSIHILSGNTKYERIYDFGNCTECDCGKDGILIHDDWQNDDNALKELVPKYRVNARIFYKLCLSEDLRNLVKSEDFKNCFSTITEQFDIVFYDKQEYWGALLLCLPDYLLQEVHSKLGKERNTLLVNVFPRKNAEIEKLMMLLSNEQKNGTGFFFSAPLKSNYNIIPLPQEPDTLHSWIYHTDSGGNTELLEETRGKFTKKIILDMNIKEHDVNYQINDKSIIAEGNTYISQSLGDNDSKSEQLITENEERRYLESLEKNRTFIYFDGTSEREKIAKQTVKELLQTVRKQCIVCDPYFSEPDFENYILPLTGKNCLIQIITTENKLSKKCAGGVLDKTNGQQLQNLVAKLESLSVNRSKIECYVLNNTSEDKVPLHDRFFIVDDTAYLIGSSLNHFGEKATTLYKTPSAKILQREADIMIKKNSLQLSNWLVKKEVTE